MFLKLTKILENEKKLVIGNVEICFNSCIFKYKKSIKNTIKQIRALAAVINSCPIPPTLQVKKIQIFNLNN